MNQCKTNIGLVTWFCPENYGTGLQAYALKKYFELSNYNVDFIVDERDILIKHQKFMRLSKVFSKRWWMKRKFKHENRVRSLMQKSFKEEHCKRYKINSVEDETLINNKVDIFVSGGDQIWNPYVTKPYLMLSFVESHKPKFSYGTSVGVKEIPNEFSELYKKYLMSFNYISVREKQSADALRTILNKKIEVVSDPTFLLNTSEWSELLNQAIIDEEILKMPYVLCYFVGERHSYWNYLEKIKKETGYEIIVLPINDEGYNNNYKKYIKVSPAEFLWLIKNAAIVCTDSFHATVFSLQFEKEFYVLKRFSDNDKKSQNGRIYNLLSHYELADRLIVNEKKFIEAPKIDYKHIGENIDKDREQSRQWLQGVLKSL